MGTATFNFAIESTPRSNLDPYELVKETEWPAALNDRLARSVRQIQEGQGARFSTGEAFLAALDEE